MISVIVATKLRPSLQTLLSSLRQQSLIYGKEWELLTRSDGINEYDARNKAAREAKGELFAFLDDDTYVDSDYLEKGKRHFEDAKIMVMDCALKGNFFGHGEEVIDKHGWGIGATLTSSPWPKKLPFSAQSITIIFASSKCLFPFSRYSESTYVSSSSNANNSPFASLAALFLASYSFIPSLLVSSSHSFP